MFRTILAGTAVLAFVGSANGAFVLTLDDLGTAGVDRIIVDDADGPVGTATSKGPSNVLDWSAGDGLISFIGTVGGFSVNFTIGTSKPILMGQPKGLTFSTSAFPAVEELWKSC